MRRTSNQSVKNGKNNGIPLTGVCKFYGSELGCASGKWCNYSHSYPETVPMCSEFQRTGKCYYSPYCKLSHLNWNQIKQNKIRNIKQKKKNSKFKQTRTRSRKVSRSSLAISNKSPFVAINTKAIQYNIFHNNLLISGYIHQYINYKHYIICPSDVISICVKYYHIHSSVFILNQNLYNINIDNGSQIKFNIYDLMDYKSNYLVDIATLQIDDSLYKFGSLCIGNNIKLPSNIHNEIKDNHINNWSVLFNVSSTSSAIIFDQNNLNFNRKNTVIKAYQYPLIKVEDELMIAELLSFAHSQCVYSKIHNELICVPFYRDNVYHLYEWNNDWVWKGIHLGQTFQDGLALCLVNDTKLFLFNEDEGFVYDSFNPDILFDEQLLISSITSPKMTRKNGGTCYNSVNNSIYFGGGKGVYSKHSVDYYNINQNKWFSILAETNHQHQHRPLLWIDSYCPFLLYIFGNNKTNLDDKTNFVERYDVRLHDQWTDIHVMSSYLNQTEYWKLTM